MERGELRTGTRRVYFTWLAPPALDAVCHTHFTPPHCCQAKLASPSYAQPPADTCMMNQRWSGPSFFFTSLQKINGKNKFVGIWLADKKLKMHRSRSLKSVGFRRHVGTMIKWKCQKVKETIYYTRWYLSHVWTSTHRGSFPSDRRSFLLFRLVFTILA